MNRPRDRKRLQHILDACREIERFARGKSREDFLQDRLLQRAVEKDLEIIGEAANQLSSETRSSYPSIPWQDIIGMRNILIHVYFEVDLETVWTTIQEDIPNLQEALEENLN